MLLLPLTPSQGHALVRTLNQAGPGSQGPLRASGQAQVKSAVLTAKPRGLAAELSPKQPRVSPGSPALFWKRGPHLLPGLGLSTTWGPSPPLVPRDGPHPRPVLSGRAATSGSRKLQEKVSLGVGRGGQRAGHSLRHWQRSRAAADSSGPPLPPPVAVLPCCPGLSHHGSRGLGAGKASVPGMQEPGSVVGIPAGLPRMCVYPRVYTHIRPHPCTPVCVHLATLCYSV